METLKDHLGIWSIQSKPGVIKEWDLFPCSPDDVRDDKEYIIEWGVYPADTTVRPKKRDRMYVTAVEALARAVSKKNGGYKLELPFKDDMVTIPVSARLTIEQMRDHRKRLAKRKQRADGFTWADWIDGKEFPKRK